MTLWPVKYGIGRISLDRRHTYEWTGRLCGGAAAHPIATMRCRYPTKDKAMKMIAIALAAVLTMTALAQAAGPGRFLGVTTSHSKTIFGK